ncbi:MAG: sigma-70 family RNA polymerase sigma factor, partial [Rhizobiales bacterium]|nr:sigma-70 family RNA polymerase sigma factor [Hyphomicrobiales bacterium]
ILRQPDLADEVMQETYVRIWNPAGDYNPREMAPILWMVAMARSHAIDVVRKQSDGLIEDEPRGFDGDAEEHGAVAQDAMTDSLRRLLACMGQLDEEHRRALLLAYYNGWSRDQLAEKFGQPTPIIKDWLRRGLVQIRECLAP